ncbi:MAG: helix-turn-helix domain-containing protein [Desulfurococcales archaeon]|nr:helix-turn-helix domain-containing protein [Desulfurococcales archaeon]
MFIVEKLALIIAGEISLSRDPGSSMRKWRELFGISQSELASHLGISPSTISDYESGRRKSPGISVVRRFVQALIEIDRSRGGRIVRHLERQLVRGYEEAPFEVHEFYTGIPASEFVERVEGRVFANEQLLPNTMLFGYTLIDSIKTITEVSSREYMKLFGSTPRRALVFTGVTTGRSPMIAVKIGRFCSDFVPEMVVLVGIDHPDFVAQRIAEKEKVVLVTTTLEPGEIVGRLREFE